MSGWISVKERLPEKDTSVLFSDKESVFLGFLLSDMGHDPFWSSYDYLENHNITHWMPLPEPPK